MCGLSAKLITPNNPPINRTKKKKKKRKKKKKNFKLKIEGIPWTVQLNNSFERDNVTLLRNLSKGLEMTTNFVIWS